jgi:hypothetical protein
MIGRLFAKCAVTSLLGLDTDWGFASALELATALLHKSQRIPNFHQLRNISYLTSITFFL